jgi:uncharacterized protein YecE (DUF72 family)
MKADVLLGTQGWDYGAWVGTFYPQGTKPAGMLSVYSRAFPTVEIESTSYGLPPDPAVQSWNDSVPADFRFALKVPQEITHERRLVDTGRVLRRFVDRVRPLEERLGPLLVQLSPAFRPTRSNLTILQQFLEGLPAGVRWAMEFRHPGWVTPATSEFLRARGVALVLVDGRWIPRDMMAELAIEPTADFGYVRWSGTGKRLADFSYPQLERERELELWGSVIARLGERVSTIYGYFSNHYQGHAPHSARDLQQLVGQEPVAPETLQEQGELF